MTTPADPPAACPARPKAASAWRGRQAARNPSAPKLGWILAGGTLATVIGLACAAALGQGWFMAVFIPVLLTAANVLHWRAAARRGHGPARSTEMPMSATGFVVSHAQDAVFERGLRSFFEYRDLGIRQATGGRVVAHVIRAAAGSEFSGQPHLHETTFQLVYVLAGWIEFEYEGQGVVRLQAGSCVHQPPGIRHREVGHSPDVELLEVVMPGDFRTVEVPSVDSPRPD